MQQDDFQITIRDAALALGISPSTCRRYLKQGKLRAFREVRSDGTERYLISRSSLLEMKPDAISQFPESSAPAPLETPAAAAVSAALPQAEGATDGDFLVELEDKLEREVETHRMVPVDLYREIREKHEKALARAAQLEGQLAQVLPELEKLRTIAEERLQQVAALEKEIDFLREQIDRQPNNGILPRFMGILRKA